MAKSVFDIGCVYKGKLKSIAEVSIELVDLLLNLGKVDPSFLMPIYVKENIKEEIELSESNSTSVAKLFGSLILDSFKKDIAQNDNEFNPTTSFSRDFGFLLLLEFKDAQKNKFALLCRLGAIDYQSIKLYNISRGTEYNFSWYQAILQKMVDFTSASYANVSINLPTFTVPFKAIKVWPPFGWITYFSNDYEVKIPDDIAGVEYEHTDKGKYIILTTEDFTISKEAYEVQKDRLLEIMKEVKTRAPEYSEG